MATTYTTNLKLGKPANGDTGWDVPLLADLDAIEALSPLSGLNVSPTEVPSASLNCRVAGGSYLKTNGTVGTFAAVGSQAMTASAANYVFLDASYALAVNTTGFPATTHIRLAVVNAGTATITSITDARVILEPLLAPCLLLAGGTLVDGANVALGTSTGTQLGTAAAQKLGFFAAPPVVQPSGAGQAAAAAQTQTALTDSTGGTPSTTLAAITAGAGYSQADMIAAKNGIASIAAELALVKADVAAIKTLEDAIRSALVSLGLIKGSA